MRSVPFNFVRADVLRDDAQRKALETQTGLPAYQEIKRRKPNWLVRTEVSELQACQHALVGKFLIVSHRWETPTTPDEKGVQLASIVTHVKSHPMLEYVWVDHWCMAQGNRTADEQAEFDRQLPNINLLYLGANILLLVDISYSSRFWTQYEAWLSMQEATPAGLRGASAKKRRCAIACLHNARPKFEGDGLVEMWSNKSPAEAHGILSKSDVVVTNGRDKEVQLPKVKRMNEQVIEALAVVQRRIRDDEEARLIRERAESAQSKLQLRLRLIQCLDLCLATPAAELAIEKAAQPNAQPSPQRCISCLRRRVPGSADGKLLDGRAPRSDMEQGGVAGGKKGSAAQRDADRILEASIKKSASDKAYRA